MVNVAKKMMHPESRRVAFVKPYLLERDIFKGYVLAPWDCLCREGTFCVCDKRPTEPEADRIAEAEAYAERLLTGIEAAKAKLAPPPKKSKKE